VHSLVHLLEHMRVKEVRYSMYSQRDSRVRLMRSPPMGLEGGDIKLQVLVHSLRELRELH